MKNKSSVYEVQEFHRGKWIPVLTKDKDGKEVSKTVRISEETAAAMNIDSEADMKSKAKKTNHFRYVKKAKDSKKDELPSYGEQKQILRDAGVPFEAQIKKAPLEVIYKKYVADKAATEAEKGE